MARYVAIVGVHGVGKTYTARILERVYGWRYRCLEAIDIAYGLKPIHRQVLFFTSFVKDFLESYYSYSDTDDWIVFDSHPIQVIPYTMWFLSIGFDHPLILAMKSLARMLPRVDLLVLLHPRSIDIVIDRIARRSRFNTLEEIDRRYVEFIAKTTERVFSEECSYVAKRCIAIEAEIEGVERAKQIYRAAIEQPMKKLILAT